MTDLRKAMLEELQRRNLSAITTRIYLHSGLFRGLSGSLDNV